MQGMWCLIALFGLVMLPHIVNAAWSKMEVQNDDVDYYGVKYFNESMAWAAGSSGASGVVSASINGANDWTTSYISSTEILTDIALGTTIASSVEMHHILAVGVNGDVTTIEEQGILGVVVYSNDNFATNTAIRHSNML